MCCLLQSPSKDNDGFRNLLLNWAGRKRAGEGDCVCVVGVGVGKVEG